MRRLLPLALVCTLAALPAPAADTLCTATVLGSQRCSGGPPRPEPRPAIRGDTSGLERVRAKPDAVTSPEIFVPAGRRTHLGTTRIDAPGPIGTCKPDMLGNLRCR